MSAHLTVPSPVLRSQHMTFYQQALADQLDVAKPTSSDGLHSLQAARAIRLDRDPAHPQRLLVVPTDRLLTWAAEHIPRLALAGSGA